LDESGEEVADRPAVALLAGPRAQPAWALWQEEKFTFKGIRPGKYRLITVERVDQFDQAKLFAQAAEIEVKPGDRIAKDLTYAK
jgi:hypothetical protein